MHRQRIHGSPWIQCRESAIRGVCIALARGRIARARGGLTMHGLGTPDARGDPRNCRRMAGANGRDRYSLPAITRIVTQGSAKISHDVKSGPNRATQGNEGALEISRAGSGAFPSCSEA